MNLKVHGAPNIRVDQLDVTVAGAVSGFQTSSLPGGADLPVRVGLLFPAGTTGAIRIGVVALNGGAVQGRGHLDDAMLAGARTDLEVSISGDALDGGSDDDLAGADLLPGPPDLSKPTCTPGAPIACTSGDAKLSKCAASGDAIEEVACQFNCSSTGGPHCRVFTPHTPVTVDLITGGGGTATVTLTGPLKINTDTGAIDGFRAANDDPDAKESKSGIIFSRSATTGLFSFASLALDSTAIVQVVGTRALVLVSSSEVSVQGIIDARSRTLAGGLCVGTLGGSGGFPGGVGGTNAGSGGGPGGGKSSNFGANGGGGGGGGYGEVGGIGGGGRFASVNNAGGVQGALVAFVYPIRGGSGGGAGSGGTSVIGGGGGGAVHIAAATKITIGGAVGALKGINVSGCGGASGMMTNAPGGGGSGGAILLEAPIVLLGDGAGLIANGGGGGGANGNNGGVSDMTNNQPAGGFGDTTYATGGPGGNNTSLGGGNAFSAAAANANQSGGGAGGACGRIVILNTSGSITPAATAVVSPKLGQMTSANDFAAATGTIDTQ